MDGWVVAIAGLICIAAGAWGGIGLLGVSYGTALLAIPILIVGSISWFVYHVFLRKLLRARRIAHCRERRLWLEASRRR